MQSVHDIRTDSAIATSGRGKCPKPKRADDRIERIVSKWEMFDVSFGVQTPRQFYHLRRQVDADRMCPAADSIGVRRQHLHFSNAQAFTHRA
jgi:hypothetical protein